MFNDNYLMNKNNQYISLQGQLNHNNHLKVINKKLFVEIVWVVLKSHSFILFCLVLIKFAKNVSMKNMSIQICVKNVSVM